MTRIYPTQHTNKKLSDGSFSVKLYIYDDIEETQYYFPLGYSCKKNEWNSDSNCFRKNYVNYKKKNLILKQKELQANEIVDDFTIKGDPFDYEVFKSKMSKKKKARITILQHYENLLEQFKEQAKKDHSKASSGKVFRETKNLIVRFMDDSGRSKKTLMEKLDPTFLFDLEHYMRSRGNKDNTIGNRMRNIKRAWNILGNQGILDKNRYPFGKGKYELGRQIQSQQNAVNPLNVDELEKWKSLDVKDRELRTKMLCLASYYLNGSNMIDLVLLRKSRHIKGDRISFHRSKTGCLVTIKITEQIKDIMSFFASDSDYVFGLLDEELHKEGQQIKDKLKKIQRYTNVDAKKLVQSIGKDSSEFTFYNFRDTFAFKLHDAGVDVRLIQQALGHKRIQQTLTYLASFGKKEIDSLAQFL